jgi:hypothetical protein
MLISEQPDLFWYYDKTAFQFVSEAEGCLRIIIPIIIRLQPRDIALNLVFISYYAPQLKPINFYIFVLIHTHNRETESGKQTEPEHHISHQVPRETQVPESK